MFRRSPGELGIFAILEPSRAKLHHSPQASIVFSVRREFVDLHENKQISKIEEKHHRSALSIGMRKYIQVGRKSAHRHIRLTVAGTSTMGPFFGAASEGCNRSCQVRLSKAARTDLGRNRLIDP
jgi:hypothetical protein